MSLTYNYYQQPAGNYYANITGCTGLVPGQIVNVPTTVVSSGNTYAVTGIEDNAFNNSLVGGLNFATATAPLKTIGKNAFKNCTSLTLIQGTSSLVDIDIGSATSIGEAAFQGCVSINGVIQISTSLTTILAYIFSGCAGISAISKTDSINNTGIDLGNVTSIGQYAFTGCGSQAGNLFTPGKLILNSSLTSVPTSAFQNCVLISTINSTANVDLSNVTYLGESSFNGCSNLSGSLILSPNMTYIGSYALSTTPTLITATNLIFSQTLTTIGLPSFPITITNIKIQSPENVNLTVSSANGINKTLSDLPTGLSFNLNTIVGILAGDQEVYLEDNNGLSITFTLTPAPVCLHRSSKITMASLKLKRIDEIKAGDYVLGVFSSSPVRVKKCMFNVVDRSTLEPTNVFHKIPSMFFGQPDPIYISGHHRLIIKEQGNYVGIQAFKVNGIDPVEDEEFQTLLEDNGELRYYHIELDCKEGVYVNGVAVESLHLDSK